MFISNLESISQKKASEDEADLEAVAHLSGEDVGWRPNNSLELTILHLNNFYYNF